MTIWIDAQLSPALAEWLTKSFNVKAIAVRDMGLREATDQAIFFAARRESVIVMTKDADFVALLEQHGTPPQVIWLTCGNTSNARLQDILSRTLSTALEMLRLGEALVEISNP